ncbi:hypothetical protein DFH06DRAFT_1347526 [Mycena polygramma]|nr:hypothetical protein DFH06DRAFT_1347526 [Mycena polygramma]
MTHHMHIIGFTVLSLLFASAYAAPRANKICMCETNGSYNDKLTRSCCTGSTGSILFGTDNMCDVPDPVPFAQCCVDVAGGLSAESIQVCEYYCWT